MEKAEKFEDLRVWKMARNLTNEIYELKEQIIKRREYGLYDQISRSSSSVMHNIAEGFESESDPQFIRYLYIAKSFAGEVRSQLYEASDKRIIEPDSHLFEEVKHLSARIWYLIESIRNSGFRGSRYK